jgi:hypothetical protein
MIEDGNVDTTREFMQEQVNKMFDFWTDSLKLPTVGPMYAFSKDFNSFANDFIALGKGIFELKTDMDSYWSLISGAYIRAMKTTIDLAPTQLANKEDFENYRRAAIEAFEYTFNELFTSTEFSEVYGKLFSSKLNVSRVMQSIVEKNFKALNLPTRGEVDEILKDIVELKRALRDMKRSVDSRNDQARVTT